MLTRKELIQRGADALSKNRGETKNAYRKRQQNFVIEEYRKLGAKVNRRQASEVLRTSPKRSTARIASTIHEYAPDRERLQRRKNKFVPRSVIAANQDASISQLWQEVLSLAVKVAKRKDNAGKLRARRAKELAGTIANATNAIQSQDGNASLLRDMVQNQTASYNASTRREFGLRTPGSRRDWKLRIAIALVNGGTRAAYRRMKFEANAMRDAS